MPMSAESSWSMWTAAAGCGTLALLATRALQRRAPIRIDVHSASGDDEFVGAADPEKSKHWYADCRSEVPVRVAKRGIASAPPVTFMQWFEAAERRFPDADALKVEDGPGRWRSISWKEYWNGVKQAARAFIHLGLPRFGSVCISGFNSPQYLIANAGAMVAGAKAVGIYPTNTAKASLYIADHCQATVIVVDKGSQLEKFLEVADELTHCKAFVVYSDDISVAQMEAAQKRLPTYTWQEFLALGEVDKPVLSKELQYRIDSQSPGSICGLVYTSGTTGIPKAVMITHDAITWMAHMTGYVFEDWGNSPEHIVSYLPLNHIAAQMLDVFVPLYTTANSANPCTLWFARPDALRGSLGETLRAARPTLFLGVPRVWEKFSEKIKAAGKQSSKIKRMIGSWAKQKGLEAYRNGQVGGEGTLPSAYSVADLLVFRQVRNVLGFDRCRLFYSAGAPISKECLEFIGSLGIPLMELYGLSETCGGGAINMPFTRKIGSVGSPSPGCELILEHVDGRDKPSEGEILVRSRCVMAGYMNDPKASASAIDSRGFFHTGDIGKIDEDGFITICGRIKELIITAGGENIAPVPIEQALLSECPALSNCIVIGDKRKFNSVLVSLKTEAEENGEGTQLRDEALEVSSHSSTVQEAMQDPKWKMYIQNGLDVINQKSVSRAQNVQKFAILAGDFSVQGGELTPSLKLRRSYISAKFHDIIEAMYR